MPVDQTTVRVTVDGRILSVPRGTSILGAASQAGVHIPTLCWHPKVSILGACRICLVEVEGLNKLIAACQTPVGEGMVVKTNTPLVKRVRQTVLELLLARHPLDCLRCDKGGWCDLQDLTYAYGPERNRFELPREDYVPVDLSPFVERDTKKCILCRRCIRVCREIRGLSVWGAMYRGFDKKIATFFEEPLHRDFQDPFNCEFCGACVDICPVGALTAKISKHLSRPWEVDTRQISCPFCSVGCLTTAHYRKGMLVKTMPIGGKDEDFTDLCFRGRFATAYVNHPSRLTSCLARRGRDLVPVGTAEAMSLLGDRLGRAGAKAAAFIGTQASEEEAWSLASLLASVAPGAGVTALDTHGEAEEGPFPLYQEHRSILVGDIPLARKLLVIGQDFTFSHPVAGIRIRRAVAAGARVLLIDPFDTLLGRHAAWWLRPSAVAFPELIEAVSAALEGGKGVPALASLVKESVGMAHRDWPGILDWFSGAGEVTIVLQKIPGGVHGAVRRAVTRLTHALAAPEWKVCYLPMDADGYGVPLMIGAAGFRSSEEGLEGILGAAARVPLGVFLRADPLGEGFRNGEWRAFRDRSDFWVTFDSFPTRTALQSDLVVPLPHFVEARGTILAASGPGNFHRLYDPPGGVAPMRNCMSQVSVVMGKATGASRPSFDAVRLREVGFASLRRSLAGEPRHPGKGSSPPRPGRGEFLLSVRFHRFPGHRLRLVEARQIIGPEERLELHPADAMAMGVATGDRVAVLFDGSRFVFPVLVTARVPERQAALPYDPEFPAVLEVLDHIGRRAPHWGAVAVRLEKG